MIKMVILCSTLQDAEDAFAIFMDYLEHTFPMLIRKVFEYGLCIETEEDIRYIFTHYRFQKMFENKGYDVIGLDEFFDDIEYGEFSGNIWGYRNE